MSDDFTEMDWPAVATAVRERMAALQLTTTRLSQLTGVSEVTIRRIRKGTPAARHQRTLSRISRGLGWPHGYLKDVAAGRDYLPHGLMIGDLIARIDARLKRVEQKLDELRRDMRCLPMGQLNKASPRARTGVSRSRVRFKASPD
jgi:hypothetical protein